MTDAVQAALPTLDGALVLGPVFFYMELPGEPVAWPRSGTRIIFPKDGRPPFVHFYTPKPAEQYKQALAQLAAIVMRRRPPTDKPLSVAVTILKGIPKSWSKREREAALAGRILPTGKPDGDNYLKMIDAFKGIIWTDDALAVTKKVVKRYSDRPAYCIEVREYVPP